MKGVGQNSTKPYQGGGGVKNPNFYLYILNGCSLNRNSLSLEKDKIILILSKSGGKISLILFKDLNF